ncbi:hypothetical protein GCM10007377_16040 [Galliscardovia ingluviei]|uniref:Uncharacterized protein n=1 Tax=Galliscardovia ingluviei TaxID=1769422 RepID=A0A8J3F0F5_9BIFI|nr:hypothetical protein [Galliscardovia ingluviei]GGI15466.1 hypothetical protein GCM10007377_16040 [Galliscardovia ingluviei]
MNPHCGHGLLIVGLVSRLHADFSMIIVPSYLCDDGELRVRELADFRVTVPLVNEADDGFELFFTHNGYFLFD